MPMPITSANATMPMVTAQAMPQMGSWWSGSPDRTVTTQRYNPQQQGRMNWAGQYGQQQLMGNQFDFAPIEQAARTGFTTRTIPSIMERFQSMGGAGTAGSSALTGALGSAGSGLEEQLAAMKQQYNLARQPLLQNLFGMGNQQQFDTSYQQGTRPGWETLLMPLLQGAGEGLGMAGGMAAGDWGLSKMGSWFGGSGAAQSNTNPMFQQFAKWLAMKKQMGA